MPLHDIYPVANGLRTDHPIPDLPFVDDAHIPVHDPRATEAIGRNRGGGMWGREDRCRDGGWTAFTTDSIRHDLAWSVRWHPEHGRSVVLYRDDDAASAHTALDDTAQLFRSGGYWWDGVTWYRPSQIFDRAREEYVRRPVPGAMTVTAADLLQTGGDPDKGRILEIDQVDPDAPREGRWLDDLALWAAHRQDEMPLTRSVVRISAPELSGDQLVGATEMAQIASVGPSTLRAYISRNEGDVPQHQATVNGRNVWARPVAEEWAERRHRSPESVKEAVSTRMGAGSVPTGVADVWSRFARMFFSTLWEDPEQRKRWALRWRTRGAVEETAQSLGWTVAAGLKGIIPTGDLGVTIRHAILDEFAFGQHLDDDAPDPVFYGIGHHVARMLDWLIRHEPRTAAYTIAEIIGEAERRFNIPRSVSEQSIATALALDSKLDDNTRAEFLERVFSPSQSADT